MRFHLLEILNETNSPEFAKYWENGSNGYGLTDSFSDCEARVTMVAGSDIYVVVQELVAVSKPWPLAKYSKNGKEVDLTDGSFYASSSGIFVQTN